MNTIRISKEQLASLGSNSLQGMIFNKFRELPRDLRIEFEQTSLGWRKAHNGPEDMIVPEYMPLVLSESILSLSKHCKNIEIGEYQSDPS
jgi:hypothetical protein